MGTLGTAQAVIESQPEFADILREEIRYSSGNESGTSDAVNGWFDLLMLQSGITTSPPAWLMLCVLAGVSMAGSVFVLTELVPVAAMAGLFGLMLPLIGIVVAVVPCIAQLYYGRYVLKMNPVVVCGAITGNLTSTPALNMVIDEAESGTPVMGYTVSYAISNVILTFLGPVIVFTV